MSPSLVPTSMFRTVYASSVCIYIYSAYSSFFIVEIFIICVFLYEICFLNIFVHVLPSEILLTLIRSHT